MLTDYFAATVVAQWRCTVPGTYLDDFADWLESRCYTTLTICSYIRAAVQFLTWALAVGYELAALDAATLTAYRAHLITSRGGGKRAHEGGNAYCGARRLMVFLRQQSLVSESQTDEPLLLTRFCTWMRQQRGVTELTLSSYRLVLRRLFNVLGCDPQHYSATQLRAFVLAQSQGYSHSKAETTVTSVRMFVRFLIATGQCASGLQYAIPRVAGWRHAGLPRYLEPAQIEHIITCCDASTPLGARDRAVILLLARLALRASDVAGLRWRDIDWVQGQISVSGKNRRAVCLPLPQEVGDALLQYLETARPKAIHEAVFLISHAPYTPILARQVSQTAERAIRRAGISTPFHGAHLFRHSAAVALLRQGWSLQAIGTLLRHSDADTTALYAKVDKGLLAQIALPWPLEEPSC